MKPILNVCSAPIEVVTVTQFAKLIKTHRLFTMYTDYTFQTARYNYNIWTGLFKDLSEPPSQPYIISETHYLNKYSRLFKDYQVIKSELSILLGTTDLDTIERSLDQCLESINKACLKSEIEVGHSPTHAIRIKPRTYLLANIENFTFYRTGCRYNSFKAKLVNINPNQMGVLKILK